MLLILFFSSLYASASSYRHSRPRVTLTVQDSYNDLEAATTSSPPTLDHETAPLANIIRTNTDEVGKAIQEILYSYDDVEGDAVHKQAIIGLIRTDDESGHNTARLLEACMDHIRIKLEQNSPSFPCLALYAKFIEKVVQKSNGDLVDLRWMVPNETITYTMVKAIHDLNKSDTFYNNLAHKIQPKIKEFADYYDRKFPLGVNSILNFYYEELMYPLRKSLHHHATDIA